MSYQVTPVENDDYTRLGFVARVIADGSQLPIAWSKTYDEAQTVANALNRLPKPPDRACDFGVNPYSQKWCHTHRCPEDLCRVERNIP